MKRGQFLLLGDRTVVMLATLGAGRPLDACAWSRCCYGIVSVSFATAFSLDFLLLVAS